MNNLLARGLVASAGKSFYRWRQKGKILDSVSITNPLILSGNAEKLAIPNAEANSARGSVSYARWENNTWAIYGSLSGEGNGDRFGSTVQFSEDGSRIAVYARTFNGGGKSYIYSTVNGALIASFGTGQHTGPMSISGDGTRIALTTGEVFEETQSGWVKLGATFAAGFNRIAISQNGLRVAASSTTNNSSAVFEFSSNAWQQVASFNFGSQGVSLNADGTQLAFFSTSACGVYQQASPEWTMMGGTFGGGGASLLTPPTTNFPNGTYVYTSFSYSAQFTPNGTLLFVGDYYDPNISIVQFPKRAQVLKFQNNTWTQQGQAIEYRNPGAYYPESNQLPASISSNGKVMVHSKKYTEFQTNTYAGRLVTYEKILP
jgi:hypothetical protein